MDKFGDSCRREIISSSAPCGFVEKTKKLLDDIVEVKKQFEEGRDRVSIPRQMTDDYYNLIDTSVEDQDALQLLKLKRLLGDRIKEVEKEIQRDWKKQILYGDDSPNDHPLPIDTEKDLQNRSGIDDSKPKSTKSVQFMKKSTVASQTSKLNVNKKSRSVPLQRSRLRVGNESSRKTPGEIEPSLHVKQADTSKNQTSRTTNHKVIDPSDIQENENRGSVIFSERFSKKIQEVYPSVKQSKVVNPVREKDKYFPCAVPLGPPSRSRTSELSTLYEEIDSAKVEKISVPENKSVSKPLVSVSYKQPTRSKLTIEAMPGVDIEPVSRPLANAKLFSFRTDSVSSKSESPEIPENRQYLDVKNVSFQNVHNIEPRFTSSQLSAILNALNERHTEVCSERPSQVNYKQIENLVIGLIQENMRNSNVYETNENTLSNAAIKRVDVATQSQVEKPKYKNSATSTATQTVSEHKSYADKSEQTSQDLKFADASVQTSMQGNLDKSVAVQSSIELEVPFHQCCNIPCTLSASNQLDLNRAVTSIPVQTEPEINVVKPSKSADVTGLLLKSRDVGVLCSESDVNIVCKDVGTNTLVNQECQTVPEIKNVSAQCEAQEPTLCHGTMTAEILNRDVSTQFEPEKAIIEMSKIQFDADARNVATQSNLLDLSLSSTTSVSTVVSDNDFMDDLLSEGEVQLPWNLRLLSLIERGVLPRNIAQSTESSGAVGGTCEESSLSEGEIPPKYLLSLVQNSRISNPNCSVASSGSALHVSSDSSVMESISQSFACDMFVDSQTGSSKNDLSEGQIPAQYLLRPVSDLSSDIVESRSEDPSFSDSENFFQEKTLPPGETNLQCAENVSKEKANATISRNSLKILSTTLPKIRFPETKSSSDENSAMFRSFLHTTSCLNESLEEGHLVESKGLKDESSPSSLEKAFKFEKATSAQHALAGVSKSPDLQTVTEENSLESKDNTSTRDASVYDHLNPLPMDPLSASHDKTDSPGNIGDNSSNASYIEIQGDSSTS